MQQKATADTRAGSIPELSDALPTPVRPIQVQVPDARTASGSRTVEIWLKDDVLTSQLY